MDTIHRADVEANPGSRVPRVAGGAQDGLPGQAGYLTGQALRPDGGSGLGQTGLHH
jgi:hypothetical protein